LDQFFEVLSVHHLLYIYLMLIKIFIHRVYNMKRITFETCIKKIFAKIVKDVII